MAKPTRGNTTTGAVDLKSRIQGFGNGPEPPPLEDTFWGSLVGVTPEQEMSMANSLTSWYEETVKGFEGMLSDIAEEMIGEPIPAYGTAGDNTATDFSAGNRHLQQPRDRETNMPRETAKPRETGNDGTQKVGGAPPQRYSRSSSEHEEDSSKARHQDAPKRRLKNHRDAPGQYRITGKETFVSTSVCLGGQILAKLKEGQLVCIEEVVCRTEENRLRGRLSNPTGWISLMNLQTGYRWAERSTPEAHKQQETDVHSETKDAVGAEELKVGDLVMRKGREAIIVSIDRSLLPPAYTVRMCDDGREIGSEEHLLRKAPKEKEEEALGAHSAQPTRPAVVDVDLLDMSDDVPTQLVDSVSTSTPASTAEDSKTSSAVEVDMLGRGEKIDKPQQTLQGTICSDVPTPLKKIQERLLELQSLKKDAAAREDFIAAQEFKRQMEALESQVEDAPKEKIVEPSAQHNDQNSPATAAAPLLPSSPSRSEGSSTAIPLLPPPPASVPLLPPPSRNSGQPVREEPLLLDCGAAPNSPSPPAVASDSACSLALIDCSDPPTSPAASSNTAPLAAAVEPLDTACPVAQFSVDFPAAPLTTAAASTLGVPWADWGGPSTPSAPSAAPSSTPGAVPAISPAPFTAFSATSLASISELPPAGEDCADTDPWDDFQGAPTSPDAKGVLPGSVSNFDPFQATGNSAGYSGAAVAGTDAKPAWRGCAVPRGISLFDPLSDKN